MALPMTPLPVPITAEPDGSYRIAGTRVLLEAFVWSYLNEAPTAEELCDTWPVFSEQQAHTLIAYYLSNREAVDAYVQDAAKRFDRARDENDRRFPRPGLRDRSAEVRARRAG